MISKVAAVFSTFLFIFSLQSWASPEAGSSFGRYVGTLKYANQKVEQLAKIDFAVSKSSTNILELKAVLTLHFGDFQSGEYVSYHFDNVIYDILNGSLVFDNAKEGVIVITKKFANGILEADVSSNAMGPIGTVVLKLDGSSNPKLPLIEPVAGEYRGKCSGKATVLQLHTMRSTEDSSRVGNAFGSYDIRGQIGRNDMAGCPANKFCMWSAITGGSYDFFSRRIKIVGNLGSWECKTDEKGFTCDDGCRFNRVSDENKSRIFTPPQAPKAFDTTPGGALSSVQGTYTGFIHHEYLDRFQPAEISVDTYQSFEEGVRTLKLSASARVFFETGTSFAESISYKFLPRDFPNPIFFSPFVLERLQDDVDAFLKITSMRDGVLRGEWYSLIFGRVGTFEVRKPEAGTVELPANAKKLTSITGSYDENWWKLEIQSVQTRAPVNSENPFFPLDMTGALTLKTTPFERNEKVGGGSYDFYTGKIGIKWGEGYIIGNRSQEDQISLRTISNVFGSVLQGYESPRKFSLKKRSGM